MADLKATAAHAVNDYFWHELKANNVLKASDYSNGLQPFLPSAQDPIFTEMVKGPPFVVYSTNDPAVQQDYWMRTQTIAYNLYSKSIDVANGFNELAKQLFEAHDASAQRLNTFLDTHPEFDDFQFKYTAYTGGGSPQPRGSEGGRYETLVTITCTYTRSNLLF